MNQVNVMFTFQYYTVITTVDVENIEDAVKVAQSLLFDEGVETDGSQHITVEVSA
jgi:hypothetical protein